MAFSQIIARAYRAVSEEVGRTELLILTGSSLIVYALWGQLGRTVLVVPGVISLGLAALLMFQPFKKG